MPGIERLRFPRYQSLAISAMPKSIFLVVVVLKFLKVKPFVEGEKFVL